VAVSLADKLDTLTSFFAEDMKPSGSKDPFALRRAALGVISLVVENQLRLSLADVAYKAEELVGFERLMKAVKVTNDTLRGAKRVLNLDDETFMAARQQPAERAFRDAFNASFLKELGILDFFADRLKVQQREAGVRHDLIDAVFALGGEDDLVRLLARVKALQAFVETPEGADLLAGYKRAANILKKEGWAGVTEHTQNKALPYTPEKEETALIAALDSAEPRARAAVEAEVFEGAMAALASLRAPVDSFFDKVTVNDPDPAKREARLALLARMRDAVHRVADFSRIEG
jgi:glycyl-tRNA synthetase beta chain